MRTIILDKNKTYYKLHVFSGYGPTTLCGMKPSLSLGNIILVDRGKLFNQEIWCNECKTKHNGN